MKTNMKNNGRITMNMTIKSLAFGALALFNVPLLPVCPEMEIWSDGTHFRYLVKDWHTDYIDGRVSLTQQADIIWAAQQPKAQDVFVLAEDSDTYSGTNIKLCRIFNKKRIKSLTESIAKARKNDKDQNIAAKKIVDNCSPLGWLIKACDASGIRAYNTECGHAEDCFGDASPEKITHKEIVNDLAEHFKEVENSISPVVRAKLFLKLEKVKKIASQQNINEDDEFGFMEEVEKIRDCLVDAKTAHKLIAWNKIQHGFICEGAGHIDGTSLRTYEIKNCLRNLGYKLIKSIGISPRNFYQDQNPTGYTNEDQIALDHPLDLRKEFQKIFTSNILMQWIEQQKILEAIESQKQQKKEEDEANALFPFKSLGSKNITFLHDSQGQKYLKETAAMTDDAPQTTATTLAFTAAHTNPMSAQFLAAAAPAPAIPAFPLLQHPAPFVASHPVLLHQTAADQSTPMQD